MYMYVHNGLGRGRDGGMDYVWRVFMMLVVQGYSVGHGQQVGREWVGKGRGAWGGGGGIKGVNLTASSACTVYETWYS